MIQSMSRYVVFRNPFDGSTVASVADCDEGDTTAAVAAAAEALKSWRSVLPRQRSAYLR
jgi:acyl-CoA reductase-like NAD-dependent aldehyde dehydrogenase